MNCPQDHFHKSRVLDSRPTEDYIYRRRECLECGARFTTKEQMVPKDIQEFKKQIQEKTDALLRVLRNSYHKKEK